MKNNFLYRGFEVKQDGLNFDVLRGGSFVPVVRNAASISQATAQLDNAIAAFR